MNDYCFFITSTSNLGDFLNAMPVLSGIHKKIGKYDLMILDGLEKFNGIKDFLMYQDLFNNVYFSHEYNEDLFKNGVIELSCYASEERVDEVTPTETCRYVNFLKERYNFEVESDISFFIKYPQYDIEIKNCYYAGDRWDHKHSDQRRKSNLFADLSDVEFIDYNKTLLENSYIIANLKKPFITNLTGVAVLADLLNTNSYVVWRPEDWLPEYRNGDNVSWDNGKDIINVFEKHFFINRNSKLIHYNDLENILIK